MFKANLYGWIGLQSQADNPVSVASRIFGGAMAIEVTDASMAGALPLFSATAKIAERVFIATGKCLALSYESCVLTSHRVYLSWHGSL